MADREPVLLDLEVRRKGLVVSKLTAEADPTNGAKLRQLLLDAVRRDGRNELDIGQYEMNVRKAGEKPLLMTFVVSAQRQTG